MRILRYVLEFSHRVCKIPYGCYCALCKVLLTSCAIQHPISFKPVMHIRIKPIAQIYIYIYIYIHHTHFFSIVYLPQVITIFVGRHQNLSFLLLFRCQSVIFTAKYSILTSIFRTKISILVVLMYLNLYPRKPKFYVLIMQPND